MMLKGPVAIIIADGPCQTAIGQATIDGATTYKVFVVVAPQDCPKPYLTLRRVPGSAQIVKGQVSDTDQVSFKVIAYADTYKKCIEILEAVRTAIDNKRGEYGDVNFDRIWFEFSEDLFDKEDNAFVISDTYGARVKRS